MVVILVNLLSLIWMLYSSLGCSNKLFHPGEQINPIVLYHKKLGMITMRPRHNGSYLWVCAAKRSNRHMGQKCRLNNKTAQLCKLLKR